MQALNDGYKPTGKVSRKTYIFEMEQAEDKLKHIQFLNHVDDQIVEQD